MNYVNLKILDIEKNDYVYSKGEMSEEGVDETDETLRVLRLRAMHKARKAFRRYNLSKANMDLVNILVHNPITEIQNEVKEINTNTSSVNTVFALDPLSLYDKYSLEIASTVDQKATDERCHDMQTADKIKVTLTNPKQQKIVFQNDSAVPKSRGCASAYRVRTIVSLNKIDASWNDNANIVAIIGYQSPGFEGADTRVIAVSGSVKTE